VGAQWLHVTPFALSQPAALRSSAGPARFGSTEYATQAEALIDLSAALTDEQKMIAEYWADGPSSELPPGHWDLFAQYVSRRDRHNAGEHGVDLDVELFFALTNAIFDAGISAWDNKCAYASARPITAIRYLFRGKRVLAWSGRYRGSGLIDGATWLPYQPSTFPTPPFPSTAPATATSVQRAPRSCACSPAGTTSARPSRSALEAQRSSRAGCNSSVSRSEISSTRCLATRAPRDT
jgi:hypothetical protein